MEFVAGFFHVYFENRFLPVVPVITLRIVLLALAHLKVLKSFISVPKCINYNCTTANYVHYNYVTREIIAAELHHRSDISN